jgi:transposase
MYRNPKLWKRVRVRILRNGESRNHVAFSEGLSRATVRKMLRHEKPLEYGGAASIIQPKTKAKSDSSPPKATKAQISEERWMRWLAALEQRIAPSPELPEELLNEVMPLPHNRRAKAMVILAKLQGFSSQEIARFLSISRVTVRRYIRAYSEGGSENLFNREPRLLSSDDENLQKAIFSLFHEPPAIHGFNRTTWRMCDLKSTLNSQGHAVGQHIIRAVIKAAGYRWRAAKVVLTSTDPDYRVKLEHVQSILSSLKQDERFFSIDEFGPFAIKMKPGKVLVPPGVQPSVPQWQKSKGCLILTAALELSSNQITHFYSTVKNTGEMIRMAQTLTESYSDCRKLYLSWDAASWHLSKQLIKFIDEHNSNTGNRPEIELAPLPASAQFLNVIESVFSGMARAIIHNSDYQSVEEAKEAIDRYFLDRNRHYQDHPKRAGKKIWGLERVSSEFNSSNNCKDPSYR